MGTFELAASVPLRMSAAQSPSEDIQRSTSIGKSLLTHVGALCSTKVIYVLNASMNFVEAGWWMRARGFTVPKRAINRYEVFDAIARDIGDRRILYLEFGVSRGWSMRYWSRIVENPDSHLHGFDSFEGLPLGWLPTAGRGSFSTGGTPPVVDDDRVEFFVGLFEETLPTYQWPEYNCLVVNIDADIYSSTAYVLSALRERISLGSYLYFDEFHHRGDEMRAFSEYLDTTDARFRLLAATRELSGVAFKRVE